MIAASTTADAGQQVAEDGDPTVAAIVGAEAVELYGLTVLDRRRRRQPGVHALRLDRAVHAHRPRCATARTAFTFATNHQPGALHAAIEPFARAGLDLRAARVAAAAGDAVEVPLRRRRRRAIRSIRRCGSRCGNSKR